MFKNDFSDARHPLMLEDLKSIARPKEGEKPKILDEEIDMEPEPSINKIND